MSTCATCLWRACCYFSILSVLFPDGDRSLLVSPSDLLVCWCESGFNVVLVSLLSLSVFSLRADRRLLLPVSTRQRSHPRRQVNRLGGEPSGRPRTGQVRFDTCRTLRLGSWSDFIRCFLTTIVNRRVVSVLCAGSGYGGSSFRQFRSFEQSRKLST